MDAGDRLVTAAGLRLHVWDGDLGVAYLPAAGSTHLLSAEACRLLAHALESTGAVDAQASAAQPALVEGLLAAGLVRRLE